MVGEVGVVGGAICLEPRTFLQTLAIYLARRCDFFKCKSLRAGSSRCCACGKLPGLSIDLELPKSLTCVLRRYCSGGDESSTAPCCHRCGCSRLLRGREGMTSGGDPPDVTLFQVF